MKSIARTIITTAAFLLPTAAFAAGLVPCTDTCGFNDLVTLIQNVLSFLIFDVATPIAALMFGYAGFLYLTDGGNEARVKQAHSIFISVLWGYGIMLIAWALVYFIFNYLTNGDQSYTLLQAPTAF